MAPLLPRWITLVVIVAVAAALLVFTNFGRPLATGAPDGAIEQVGPIAFTIEPPDDSRFAEGTAPLAVSPDGRRVAFATGQNQISSNVPERLWVRPLGSVVAEPIAGTETGYRPFWSPDGRFIGFSATNGMMKRVEVSGGSVLTLSDWGADGTWGSSGTIVFTGRDCSLYRVSQDGGAATAVTTVDRARGEAAHRYPSFLPDGRRFVFLAFSASGESALYIGSIDSTAVTRIVNVVSKAMYANGRLYYQRQGALVAQSFDPQSGQLRGVAAPIATSIRFAGEGGAAFSVSGTGVVVYATGAGATDSLRWFNTEGTRQTSVGEPGAHGYPTLSQDGNRLAVNRMSADGLWDIWLVDMVRNVPTRWTFKNSVTYFPIVWSPDDSYLVFASQNPDLVFNLHRRSVTGDSTDEPLFESADDKQPSGFSPDGRILLFNREFSEGHGTDVWALPVGGSEPFAVLDANYHEQSAVFSPDGRWIAYASDESGVFQVYAQPFRPGGSKIQISRDGGSCPRWTPDGTILYSSAKRLWSVDVRSNGDSLRAGIPKTLFSQDFVGSRFGCFVVNRSGRRFLLVVPEAAKPSSLRVLLNPLD